MEGSEVWTKLVVFPLEVVVLDRSFRGAGTAGAALTAGAGAVHFAAAVPHFGESPMMGIGFAAVGWV